MYAAPLVGQRRPISNHDRDDRATIAVFATVTASVIALFYYVARSGFANPVQPVVSTVGTALFITVMPFFACRWSVRGHYLEPEPWWRSQSALTLAALVLSALAGLLAAVTGLNLWWLLSALGYAAALAAIIAWVRQGRQRANLVFLLGATAIAISASGVAWSTPHRTPLIWEALAYRGDVDPETLLNISIARSPRVAGIPGAGIDGGAYVPYRFASAWLTSQWGHLAGTDELAAPNLAPPVIVIPLFLSAILLLAVELKKSSPRQPDDVEPALKADYAALGVFVAVSLGMIPTAAADALGILNWETVARESYLVAVSAFLLALATALAWWRRRRTTVEPDDLVFLLIFSPVLLMAIGFFEPSVMLLLFFAGAGLALLGGFARDRWIAIAVLLCGGATLIAYRLVSAGAANPDFPVRALRPLMNAVWEPYFVFVGLFWSWLYVFLRIREQQLDSIGAVRHAAMEGKITDVILVAIVAVVGWVIGALLDSRNGPSIYFGDVQRWLSAAFMVAAGSRWIPRGRGRRESPPASGRAVGRVRLSKLWFTLLVVPSSITIILNAARPILSAARSNVALRRGLYAEASAVAYVRATRLRDPRILSAGLRHSPNFAVVAALRRLDATPSRVKHRTLLFFPQSGPHYSGVLSDTVSCSLQPVVVAAASGLALFDGRPSAGCNRASAQGPLRDDLAAAARLHPDAAPLALCAEATARGFSRAVVLDAADGLARTRSLECPVRIAPLVQGAGRASGQR